MSQKYLTDEEILTAIDEAGDHRHHWRRHDWPEKGEKIKKAWVIPNDIGVSTSENTSLLKRLKRMVEMGLLEIRYHGHMPRFRRIHGAFTEETSLDWVAPGENYKLL